MNRDATHNGPARTSGMVTGFVAAGLLTSVVYAATCYQAMSAPCC